MIKYFTLILCVIAFAIWYSEEKLELISEDEIAEGTQSNITENNLLPMLQFLFNENGVWLIVAVWVHELQ